MHIESLIMSERKESVVTRAIRRAVPWTDPYLARVTRLQLIQGPNRYNVAFAHGLMKSGEYVRVQVPFHWLPVHGIEKAITRFAIRDGVQAKDVGIFSSIMR